SPKRAVLSTTTPGKIRAWALLLDDRHSYPKPGQQLQANPRVKGGHYIINHDPQAALNLPVKPTDGPGFYDIEKTKQHEPYQHPQPSRRREEHSEPVAHHFIPHDSAMVMHTQRPGTALAPINTQLKGHQQPAEVKGPGELLDEQKNRHSRECAEGARRPRRKTSAKPKGKRMFRVALQCFEIGIGHEFFLSSRFK